MDYDALEEIEDNISNIPVYVPNDRYDINQEIVAIFNSTTDVNQFCNKYNHYNGYNGLKLGQRIQINDGVYNKAWYIAGFDCEYNRQASDGTTYNNGYGICLIPEISLISVQWSETGVAMPYISSLIHTSSIPTIVNNLINILSDHLINRNVLLSDNVDYDGKSSSYIWTTSYATLTSISQLNGEFGKYSTIYDDGEANYQLPISLFTLNILKAAGFGYFSRGLAGYQNKIWYFRCSDPDNKLTISSTYPTNTQEIAPLIYIR